MRHRHLALSKRRFDLPLLLLFNKTLLIITYFIFHLTCFSDRCPADFLVCCGRRANSQPRGSINARRKRRKKTCLMFNVISKATTATTTTTTILCILFAFFNNVSFVLCVHFYSRVREREKEIDRWRERKRQRRRKKMSFLLMPRVKCRFTHGLASSLV